MAHVYRLPVVRNGLTESSCVREHVVGVCACMVFYQSLKSFFSNNFASIVFNVLYLCWSSLNILAVKVEVSGVVIDN